MKSIFGSVGIVVLLGTIGACGGVPEDSDVSEAETVGEVEQASIIGVNVQGFFRVTDFAGSPVYSLYNTRDDSRWTQGDWYCHVSDNGQLNALGIAYRYTTRPTGEATFGEITSLLRSGTQGYCPWPNGMIGRVDPDGTTNVYSIQHANYKNFGTVCWVNTNAKVLQAGGWGRVWTDPTNLTFTSANLARTTIPRDNSCPNASVSTSSCKWGIPACPNTYPW